MHIVNSTIVALVPKIHVIKDQTTLNHSDIGHDIASFAYVVFLQCCSKITNSLKVLYPTL